MRISEKTWSVPYCVIDLGNGDAIHLALPAGQTDPAAVRIFDHLQFADGSVMTFEDFLIQGFDFDGTEGNDSGEPDELPALVGSSAKKIHGRTTRTRKRCKARACGKKTAGFTAQARLARSNYRETGLSFIKISIKTNTYVIFRNGPITPSTTQNGGSKWAL